MSVTLDPELLEPRSDFEGTPERMAFTAAITASMAWCLHDQPRMYFNANGKDPHEIWGLPALGTNSDLEQKWLEAVSAYEPFVLDGYGPAEERVREDFNEFLIHIHMTLWGMRSRHCAEKHHKDAVWVGGLWEKHWDLVQNGPMKPELLIKFVLYSHGHYMPHCNSLTEAYITRSLELAIARHRRA